MDANATVDGAGLGPREIVELRRKYEIAVGALAEIVEMDFRGNRPREQQVAWAALERIDRLAHELPGVYVNP